MILNVKPLFFVLVHISSYTKTDVSCKKLATQIHATFKKTRRVFVSVERLKNNTERVVFTNTTPKRCLLCILQVQLCCVHVT